MGDLAQALCLFCTVITGTPAPQMPQTSGDIKYRHEDLGHGKHLLRLSVDYYLLQPQSDMRRRMETFAQDYAQQTCPVTLRLRRQRQPLHAHRRFDTARQAIRVSLYGSVEIKPIRIDGQTREERPMKRSLAIGALALAKLGSGDHPDQFRTGQGADRQSADPMDRYRGRSGHFAHFSRRRIVADRHRLSD